MAIQSDPSDAPKDAVRRAHGFRMAKAGPDLAALAGVDRIMARYAEAVTPKFGSLIPASAMQSIAESARFAASTTTVVSKFELELSAVLRQTLPRLVGPTFTEAPRLQEPLLPNFAAAEGLYSKRQLSRPHVPVIAQAARLHESWLPKLAAMRDLHPSVRSAVPDFATLAELILFAAYRGQSNTRLDVLGELRSKIVDQPVLHSLVAGVFTSTEARGELGANYAGTARSVRELMDYLDSDEATKRDLEDPVLELLDVEGAGPDDVIRYADALAWTRDTPRGRRIRRDLIVGAGIVLGMTCFVANSANETPLPAQIYAAVAAGGATALGLGSLRIPERRDPDPD